MLPSNNPLLSKLPNTLFAIRIHLQNSSLQPRLIQLNPKIYSKINCLQHSIIRDVLYNRELLCSSNQDENPPHYTA